MRTIVFLLLTCPALGFTQIFSYIHGWESDYQTSVSDVYLTDSSYAYGVGGVGDPESFSYDFYLFKKDTLGNLIWEKRVNPGISGEVPVLRHLIPMADGNFFSVGELTTCDVNSAYLFFLKFDPQGNQIWLKNANLTSRGAILSLREPLELSSGSLLIPYQDEIIKISASGDSMTTAVLSNVGALAFGEEPGGKIRALSNGGLMVLDTNLNVLSQPTAPSGMWGMVPLHDSTYAVYNSTTWSKYRGNSLILGPVSYTNPGMRAYAHARLDTIYIAGNQGFSVLDTQFNTLSSGNVIQQSRFRINGIHIGGAKEILYGGSASKGVGSTAAGIVKIPMVSGDLSGSYDIGMKSIYIDSLNVQTYSGGTARIRYKVSVTAELVNGSSAYLLDSAWFSADLFGFQQCGNQVEWRNKSLSWFPGIGDSTRVDLGWFDDDIVFPNYQANYSVTVCIGPSSRLNMDENEANDCISINLGNLVSRNFPVEQTGPVLYPNPASETIQADFSSDIRHGVIVLREISGREINRFQISGPSHSFSVIDFTPGIYLAEFHFGDEVFMRKFSVIR